MEGFIGHAFISYARVDWAEVDLLQRVLEEAGIPVWRDTAALWPGDDWRAKIRKAITDDALVFIACFSSRSVARPKGYQNEELLLAVEQLRLRRPKDPWLIPVRLDDCEVPDLDLGGGRTLTSIHWADFFGESRDDAARRLVTAVRRLLKLPEQVEQGGRQRDAIQPDAVAERAETAQVGAALAQIGSPSEQERLASIRMLELIVQRAERAGNSPLHRLVLSALADFVREHSDEPWPEGRQPPFWAPTPQDTWPGSRRNRQDPPLPDITAAVNVIGRYPARDASPGEIDLAGVNLSLALLNDMDFSGVSFYMANLTGVDFKRTRLIGSRLELAVLLFADMDGADLSGASLATATVNDKTLRGVRADENTNLPPGWRYRDGQAVREERL